MFYTALRDPKTGRLFADSLIGFDNRQERNTYLAQKPFAVPLSRDEVQSAFGLAALDAIHRQAHPIPIEEPATDTAAASHPEPEPETPPFSSLGFSSKAPSFPGSKLFDKVRGGVHRGS